MIFAELSPNQKAIDVHFPYDSEAVACIKRIPGRRFVPRDKGGPLWRVPLDVTTGERLREEFGPRLKLGDGLRAWGRDEVQKHRNLRSLARMNRAKLSVLPKALPDMYKFVKKRPYQTADIKLMAKANVLNANQPGTGKTIETIGSWVESGLIDEGPNLVIAPVLSLENVWLDEIHRFIDIPVFTDEDPGARQAWVEEGLNLVERGESCVICVNPDMLRLVKVWDNKKDAGKAQPKGNMVARRDRKGNIYAYRNELQRVILRTNWKTCTVDEFHKHGMGNRDSLFTLSVQLIKAEKRAALSGTPIGGRPRKLWVILNWLEPEEYSSEWRWIDQWLETGEDHMGYKTVGDIKPGREDAFYEAHARHMVRRLKSEALPGIPPQVHIPVMCKMTKQQKDQYRTFAAEAEIRIDEERLTARSVLAEYARLKQFANARQKLIDGVPYPTPDSGKLAQLMEKLDEEGIRRVDPEPHARAIVASESSRMVYMVADHLGDKGIETMTLTGDTKNRREILKRFKSKVANPIVIVMTIQTGGVSINLEEAGSMHALDETWNPDDLEQFFDRGDRGSRTTPLRCYIYRTKGTIQEYIQEVNEGKKVTNNNILDLRRRMYKGRT